MNDYAREFPITMMARVLEVSTSGYYDWRRRSISPRQQRRQQNTETVCALFHEYAGIYGSRKITEELIERQIKVCRNTVATIMRENSLQSKVQRRRRFVLTTNSNHADPCAPNHLARDFQASAPNQKWVADITYVPIKTGWAYLAAVMDLFSRRIVGWAVSDRLETSLVLEALESALALRQPNTNRAHGKNKLLHHSDRGCQYTSGRYRRLLAESGIECSMSRHGDCYDNAVMERFMNSYKNEWSNHRRYHSLEEVRTSAFKYIEMFYNRERRHQALNYLSPVQFEAKHAQSNIA